MLKREILAHRSEGTPRVSLICILSAENKRLDLCNDFKTGSQGAESSPLPPGEMNIIVQFLHRDSQWTRHGAKCFASMFSFNVHLLCSGVSIVSIIAFIFQEGTIETI